MGKPHQITPAEAGIAAAELDLALALLRLSPVGLSVLRDLLAIYVEAAEPVLTAPDGRGLALFTEPGEMLNGIDRYIKGRHGKA